ncbi:hypothetical protein [Photobacterium swingsii]|uniref:hypothetical protein n=1 Tax=Photobacterium swingsii TaxID=680026 RepID=UPI004067D61B
MSKSDFTSAKALFKKAYSSERAADNGRAHAARAHLRLSIVNAWSVGNPELMMERLFWTNHAVLYVMTNRTTVSFEQSKRLRDAFAKRAVGGEL